MAIINFLGPDSGDLAQFQTVSGAVAFMAAGAGDPNDYVRIYPTGTAGSYTYLNNTTGRYTGSTWHSFLFKYDVKPTANYEYLFGLQANGVGIILNTDGTLGVLHPNLTVKGTGTTVLNQGEWYFLEVYYDASTGYTEVYLNGAVTPEVSGTGQAITNYIATFGKFSNRNGNSVDFGYCNIVASDSRLSGQPSILRMPGAAGTPTYDQFTKLGGTTIDAVWNNKPYSTASYAYAITMSPVAQTMLVVSPDSVGLASDANILAAKVSGIVKTTSATNGGELAYLRSRFGGADHDYSVPLTTSDKHQFGVFTPTYSDLNGIEIGMVHNTCTASRNQVAEDIWLSVLFIPSSGSSTLDKIYGGDGVLTNTGAVTYLAAYDFGFNGTGSMSLAGSASVALELGYVGNGVLNLGGSAIAVDSFDYTFTGNGSLYVAGTAPPEASFQFISNGSGTLALSGAATTQQTTIVGADFVFAGSGNASITGSALTRQAKSYSYAGTGSVVSGGAATLSKTFGYRYTGTGSLILSGQAQTQIVASANKSYTGQGSLALHGTAATSFTCNRNYQASGAAKLTSQSSTIRSTNFGYVGSGRTTITGSSSYYANILTEWAFDVIRAVPCISVDEIKARPVFSADEIRATPQITAGDVHTMPVMTIEVLDATPQITSEDMQSHVVITAEGFTT